jgi:uncharacterized protein (DUF2461 family)
MTGFVGFPDGALDFFVELEANNERGWWLANKDRFDADVKKVWARAEPVFAWLDAHVGPSLEPPPDR